MGYHSDLMIKEAERGFSSRAVEGRHVCSDCFGDPHISKVVANKAVAHRCDYCGSSGKLLAASLVDVLDFMVPQIQLEYGSADQLLPRDPETKDRMFPEDEFDARSLLEEQIGLDLPGYGSDRLMEDLAAALSGDDWCRLNPLGIPDSEAIGSSWDAFSLVVKHRRRFFFLQHKDPELEEHIRWGAAAFDIPQLLERIGAFCCDHKLVHELKAGSNWFRVQAMEPGESAFGARRMGPPPYHRANLPNRMSPAGVPMFYGAAEVVTALAEVGHAPGRYAIGRFETMRDILVLDVREVPEIPSLFDPDKARDRAVAKFMRSFIADFRKEIDRKARPHVDYLPTQVVTEYFRTMVVGRQRQPVEGVLYASTKDDKDAVVLFAENGDVLDDDPDAAESGEEWLRMIGYEEIDHAGSPEG